MQVPPITAQELSSPSEQHRTSRSFVWSGLLVVAVLAAVDVAGGLIVGQKTAANISGTFALAPALTALSRSPRHTLAVGLPAVLVAAALAVYDDVPWGTGLVRTLVVVSSVTLSTLVARAQSRQWAQLQDRRQAARTLQAAMLTQLPRPDHLQLVSRYLPASQGDQVGGDWYDAVVDADGATVLVIGDVVGHDIHAAAAMGQLRGLLRAYAIETSSRSDGGRRGGGQSPAQLLQRVDEAITRLGLDVLATVVVVRIEQEPGDVGTGVRRLRWSNAGHLPPMLLLPDPGVVDASALSSSSSTHVPGNDVNPDPIGAVGSDADDAPDGASGGTTEGASDGASEGALGNGPGGARTRRLRDEPDLLLGLGLSDVDRRDHVEDFPVGSTLLLYTDGLVERRDQLLDEGLDRLAQAMVASAAVMEEEAGGREELDWSGPGGSLQRWVDEVLPATLQGGHQDDVAVLAVRAHPEDRPRPSEAGPSRVAPGSPLL